MKKIDKGFVIDQAASEKIGRLLSNYLHPSHGENCVPLEEIAALAEGNIKAGNRERIMDHLSRCARCYQVFLLTSDLIRPETKPMRGFIFSQPMRLAASIIGAIFSLFLFYKIVLIPGIDPAAQSKNELIIESPAPVRTGEHKTGKREEKSGKKQLKKKEPGRRVAELTEEKTAGKKLAQAAAPPGSKKGDGLPAETEINKKEIDEVKVEGRHKKDRLYAAREAEVSETPAQKSTVPEKMGLSDKRNDEPKLTAAADREKAAVISPCSETRAVLERLNLELSRDKTFFSAAEIEIFFKEAVIVSEKLERESRHKKSLNGESKLPANPEKQENDWLPAILPEKGNEGKFIVPNIRYFYEKSEPGTRENRFFNLALSGWCDEHGCYGNLRGEIEAGEREKLLNNWQVLKPELTGIFLRIADRTIRRLGK